MDKQPEEIIFLIFGFVDVWDLLRLSVTSSNNRRLVERYWQKTCQPWVRECQYSIRSSSKIGQIGLCLIDLCQVRNNLYDFASTKLSYGTFNFSVKPELDRFCEGMHVLYQDGCATFIHGIVESVCYPRHHIHIITLGEGGYDSYFSVNSHRVFSVTYVQDTKRNSEKVLSTASTLRSWGPRYHHELWNSQTFAVYCMTGIYHPTPNFKELMYLLESRTSTIPNKITQREPDRNHGIYDLSKSTYLGLASLGLAILLGFAVLVQSRCRFSNKFF